MTFNDLQMTFRPKTTVPPPESSEMLQKLSNSRVCRSYSSSFIDENMISTVFWWDGLLKKLQNTIKISVFSWGCGIFVNLVFSIGFYHLVALLVSILTDWQSCLESVSTSPDGHHQVCYLPSQAAALAEVMVDTTRL